MFRKIIHFKTQRLVLSIAVLLLVEFFSPLAYATTIGNSNYINYQNVRIHYFKEGNGPQTLLFVHGVPLEASSWHCQINYFSKKYTVVAIDLPGFGLSSSVPKPITNLSKFYSDTISDVLNQLKLSNVIYIGVAMGGHVGMQFAVDHADQLSRLILINTSPKFSTGPGWPYGLDQKRIQKAIRRIQTKNLKEVAEAMAEITTQESCEPPAIINTVRFPFTKMGMLAGRESLLLFFTKIAKEDLRPLLSKITVPTLIMMGMLGKEVPPEVGVYMRTTLPHSQLVELNAKDHFMFATSVTLVNRIIENFIGPQCDVCEYGMWKQV